MSFSEYAERSKFPPHIATMFMRAVGCEPVECVVMRRGKVYQMWADKRMRQKIISFAQLESMDLATFVEWLRGRYACAKILFPDATVYQEVSNP